MGKVRLDTFAEEHGLDYDFLQPGQTLLDVLDADISGRTFSQGKPHPEIFLTAARELGVPARECFVVEDAVSGVTAAKAGEMAALGVARGDDAQLLSEAGADLVVATLDAVDGDALLDGRLVSARGESVSPGTV
jgi:beta-phosphoglucomutase